MSGTSPAEGGARSASARAPVSELELRRRFHDGCVCAFAALAEPEANALYTLCLRLAGNAADAEDAAQEALARALARHHQYDPGRAFRPWLFTIAVNGCRDRARSAWLRRVVTLDVGAFAELVGPPAAPAASTDEELRAGLLRLPWRAREVLTLVHLDGLSYAEAAEIAGVKPEALRKRVARAEEMLREVLLQMYPGRDAGYWLRTA